MDPKSGLTVYKGVVQPKWLTKPAHMFEVAKDENIFWNDQEFYFDEESKELKAVKWVDDYRVVNVAKVLYHIERTFTDADFTMEECPDLPTRPSEKDTTDSVSSLLSDTPDKFLVD